MKELKLQSPEIFIEQCKKILKSFKANKVGDSLFVLNKGERLLEIRIPILNELNKTKDRYFVEIKYQKDGVYVNKNFIGWGSKLEYNLNSFKKHINFL